MDKATRDLMHHSQNFCYNIVRHLSSILVIGIEVGVTVIYLGLGSIGNGDRLG